MKKREVMEVNGRMGNGRGEGERKVGGGISEK